MKKISIIIPSCTWHELKPCLESIVKNTDFKKHNAEAVVVLNGCDIDAIDYIKSLGDDFRFLWFDRRIGVCSAMNIAVDKIANGDLIVKLDDDIVILDWAKGCLDWLYLLSIPFADEGVGQSGAWLQRQFNFDVLVGFLTMTTRKVWNEAGGLDAAFNPGGGEDIDYSIKVNKLGYKVTSALSSVDQWPIWHKSTGTWRNEVGSRNENMLSQRYKI